MRPSPRFVSAAAALVALSACSASAEQVSRPGFLDRVDLAPHAALAHALRERLAPHCSAAPRAACEGILVKSVREGTIDYMVVEVHGLYVDGRWVKIRIERDAVTNRCAVRGAWASGFPPPDMTSVPWVFVGRPPKDHGYTYALDKSNGSPRLVSQITAALGRDTRMECAYDDA